MDTEAEKAESAALPLSPDVVKVLVQHHREFLGFLERRVESRAVAEDILQEAFVRGINRADELRSEHSVVAWFYQVLRHAVIDYYRRQGAKARGLERFADELTNSVEPAAELTQLACQCVNQLAETLKPEYADVLRRVEVEGVPVKDYAEQVGISASNAAVRAFRAREALRKQVQRSCGTCADHGCLDCTCQSGSCQR